MGDKTTCWALSAVLTLVVAGGCASSPKKAPQVTGPAADPAPKPAGKPILAIFDLEAQGLGMSGEVLARLSDYLNVIIVETGRFKVVPRQQVVGRLRGQKKASYKSCYDQQCQIDVGRELAASKTLATRVVRLGSSCTVTATLYDLKTATAETAARQEGACDEAEIAAMLVPVVSKISGKEVVPEGGGDGGGAAQGPGIGRRGTRSVRLDCPDCVLQVDEEEEEDRRRKQYKRDRRSHRRYRSAYQRYRRRVRVRTIRR